MKGMQEELEFWKRFVQSDRFWEYWVPDNVINLELRPSVAELVRNHCQEMVLVAGGYRVLDVGSGVVSILQGVIPKDKIITVDPLGESYQTIFDYKKYEIPPPLSVPVEKMSEVLTGRFDIVHMSNAMDHCQSPYEAYYNLVRAVKPGGYLIIQGFENEGFTQKYSGFHQWDMQLIDGGLSFQNQKGQLDLWVGSNEHSYGMKMTLDTGRVWIVWIERVI